MTQYNEITMSFTERYDFLVMNKAVYNPAQWNAAHRKLAHDITVAKTAIVIQETFLDVGTKFLILLAIASLVF